MMNGINMTEKGLIKENVPVKVALDHGWSSIKGEHILWRLRLFLWITLRLPIMDCWSIRDRSISLVREDLESRQQNGK